MMCTRKAILYNIDCPTNAARGSAAWDSPNWAYYRVFEPGYTLCVRKWISVFLGHSSNVLCYVASHASSGYFGVCSSPAEPMAVVYVSRAVFTIPSSVANTIETIRGRNGFTNAPKAKKKRDVQLQLATMVWDDSGTAVPAQLLGAIRYRLASSCR